MYFLFCIGDKSYMYFSLLPNWIFDISLTFSPNSSTTWNIALFFPTICYDDHSKYVCSKNSLIVKKSNSITIVIFDKWIYILYSLSLHALIFKYNKVLKHLYGRRKVLVCNKMTKMANFWKISHFNQNGDFLKKVKTFSKK